MPKLSTLLQKLESLAPRRYAFDFDKVGLQVGEESVDVSRAAVSLDRSLGAIRFAKENGCQLLLSHHPLIFNPLEDLTGRSHTNRSVLELARSNIAFVAAHTNWDSAKGGINDVLAARLGLREVESFGSGAQVTTKKLIFFAPSDRVEQILDAIFATGAGKIGSYQRCSFTSDGIGRFSGDHTTQPAIGRADVPQTAPEVRVEVFLPSGTEKAAERALLRHHPYETPAYNIHTMTPTVEQPIGRIGEIDDGSFADLLAKVDMDLSTVSLGWGDPQKPIRRVAVVGGAADNEWINAQRAGADVLVTGEVKQHVALEASESGLCIVAAGHFATEQPGALELGDRMAELSPEIEWLPYCPSPGWHGRPTWRSDQ